MFLNKIKNLKPVWFQTLGNLQFLELYLNEIEELPPNVFSDLKNLTYVTLSYNKLKVIQSVSFGYLTKLTIADFSNNQINAFDEQFIDNTRVMSLVMNINNCVDKHIYDESPMREFMRIELAKCFENYEQIISGKILLFLRLLNKLEFYFCSKATTTVTPTTTTTTPTTTTTTPTTTTTTPTTIPEIT